MITEAFQTENLLKLWDAQQKEYCLELAFVTISTGCPPADTQYGRVPLVEVPSCLRFRHHQ